MSNQLKYIFAMLFLGLTFTIQAQNSTPKRMRYNFDSTGKYFVQMTFLNQVWLTHVSENPGTTVYGTPVDQSFNIGLRRTRIQLFGQLSDKVFFYTQFGQNNFSNLSPRYTGSFFHDAIVEYKVFEKNLSLGSGLTGWSGLARYASPSIGSILTLDAPLYQQATNGVNDQFLRKLSTYAKGKLGKLDYRLAATKPMSIQNSSSSIKPISKIADFSLLPPKMQWQGYFMYQFKDQESNLTPYTTGTYLGSKKVFNIGAGFIYQPDALTSISNGDTVLHAMMLYGGDVFYDAPLNHHSGSAITVYASGHHFDFGPGYIRNVGVMNPANGMNANGTFGGFGNSFPMIGTGNVFYGQVGYLFKKDLFKNGAGLQPYAAVQYALYDRLSDPMQMTEVGFNYLESRSHMAKITMNMQMRPIFQTQGNGDIINTTNKSMFQIQYQISI